MLTSASELSATLFGGEPDPWARYLRLPSEQRYRPEVRVVIRRDASARQFAFEPANDCSRTLAELMTTGFGYLERELAAKPAPIREVLDELILDGDSIARSRFNVRVSSVLPSEGAREMERDDDTEVTVVFNTALIDLIQSHLAQADSSLPEPARLGLLWPMLSRLLAMLAYPARPRDRFVAKIAVQAKVDYVALNLLYESPKWGAFAPTLVGRYYEQLVAAAYGWSSAQLWANHPYFRMLSRLGFLLRGAPFRRYEQEAQIMAREFLDTGYLRLSLAGPMPPLAPAMRPMEFRRAARTVKTPKPKIGAYGIVDEEDLAAWKAVDAPFRELGFTLIRQLGIGEFGRVYESINDNSCHLPERVALKVDRVIGKRKRLILGAEQAMELGRALAHAPHAVRLYDAGRLAANGLTYHLLQAIDGDTLDNLLGVTGTEHASVSPPPGARRSEQEAEQEWQRAVRARQSETWRRARTNAPFTHDLTPAMVLDLLTSILLWLEEVHGLGYAINDLKHGNLMMSRRGQLKGIDLDSYTKIQSPMDKMTDFMFLAVSLILLLLSARVERGRNLQWEELVGSPRRFSAALAQAWPFGDVEALSDGRVSKSEIAELLVAIVQRSRHLDYVKRPELFSEDIVRLIELKRRLLVDELVID